MAQRQSAGLQESVAMPPADRSVTTSALAALSAADLGSFPRERILVLQTDVLDVPELQRLRPRLRRKDRGRWTSVSRRPRECRP